MLEPHELFFVIVVVDVCTILRQNSTLSTIHEQASDEKNVKL